jgi:hypothetical protein
MKRTLAYAAFGIGHLIASLVAFTLAVVGAEGLYLSGRLSHPSLLAQFWQVASAVLCFPIPLAILFSFPSFPWKTGWAFLPFIANSTAWSLAIWHLVPAFKRRRAGVA